MCRAVFLQAQQVFGLHHCQHFVQGEAKFAMDIEVLDCTEQVSTTAWLSVL